MALVIYRRHRSTCSQKGTANLKSCECALWFDGTLFGKRYHKSAKTRNFRGAESIKLKLERGDEEPAQPKGITIKEALDAFIRDCEARNLNHSTLRKYRTLSSHLTAFAKAGGLDRCSDLTTHSLRDFRGTRNLAPRTAQKELERLRAFFKFCVENGWLQTNPAKTIKAPQVKINPRLPFGEKEIQAILSKAKDDRELAFILILRHTGLRIGDASLLRVSALSDNRIFLHTTKSGTPVSILIPDSLLSLLKQLPQNGGYFFVRGESTSMHTTADLWRRRIKILCKAAGVMPDHPHRFRHSLAADLLTKGASVEQVAAILGNSPAIVSKHYSQWIKSRQDALDSLLESTWKRSLALVKK